MAPYSGSIPSFNSPLLQRQGQGSSGAAPSGSGSGSGKPALCIVWGVQWRDQQNRKNKTWENDGYLLVRGSSASLRNDEGKQIGAGSLAITMSEGVELKLSGKDVRLDDLMDFKAYQQMINPSAQPKAGPSSSFNSTPTIPKPQNQFNRLPLHKPLPKPKPHPNFDPPKSPKKENNPPPLPSSSSSPPYRSPSPDPQQRLSSSSSSLKRHRPRSPSLGAPIPSSEAEDDDEEVDELGGEVKEVSRPLQKRRLPPWETMKMDGEKGKGKEKEVEVKKDVEMIVEGAHYYLVQWRKHSTKKHPIWEGDGVLIIEGRNATLKDRTDGRDLASGKCKGQRLETGDPVVLGNKVIEIDDVLAEEEFISGKCFTNQPQQASVTSFYLPGISAKPPKPFSLPSLNGAQPLQPKKAAARFDPTAEGAIVMTRPSASHEMKYNKRTLPVVDVVVDPLIGNKMRKHQVEGVKFMYECMMGMKNEEGEGCILADEMGLGKTIQAIALIWTMLKQNPYHNGKGIIERALIVCPVTLVKNWAAEIRKWLGKDRISFIAADGRTNVQSFTISKSYQVLIIGYEKLRTVIDDLKYCQPPIGLVICDEGHRLKSADTLASKAIKLLSTRRRIILTGTPIQNDLKEYHSLIDFVNPGILDTYAAFKKVYEQPILKSREPNCTDANRRLGIGRQAQLSEMSQTFMLRRDASEIAKFLPPKVEYTVFVLPTQLEMSLYQHILDGKAVKDVLGGSSGATTSILSLLMMLRNICNSPGLLMKPRESDKGPATLTEEVVAMMPKSTNPYDFALSGKLMALGALLKILRLAGEDKIVVVSNFTTVLDIIEKHCGANSYPTRRLDGSTPQSDRVQMVNDFNRGPLKTNFIFLLSSKSGGTGLNIIGASRLVLFDSDWNPSTDAQVMARIHRQGQTKQCVIYRFLTTGTIDEKIYQRQITKLGLSGSLMDVGSGGSGKKAGNAFTGDELRNIFKLHREIDCQTHDLLGCTCLSDGAIAIDDDDDDLDESDEELETASQIGGFKQASQWARDEPEETAKKERRNLSVLKEWVHHSCLDKDSINEISDEVLTEVIYQLAKDTAHQPDLSDSGFNMPLKGGRISFAFSRASGGVASATE